MKAFGYAALILIFLYAYLEFNHRRALKRNPTAPLGRQSVHATFVMKTVDAFNSGNHDDVLIFELADHTQLTFSVENAPTDSWPISGTGTLTYIAHGDKNEWVSFTPDAH